MAKFDEFFEHFAYDPENFKPDEFKAAARAAYQEDISGITSVVSAKDAEIAEAKQKAAELGKANWDLLMKLGTPIPDGTTPTGLNPTGGQEPTEPRSIDSFFGTKKEGQ